jgi:predicted lipoprotein with Yx(FWY)xxD motif
MIRTDVRLLGIAGVAAIALAACGGGGNSNNSSGSSGTKAAGNNSVVSLKNTSGAGKVLVNSDGMTLYSPDQEKNGKIECTGACTGFWLPLTVSGKTVAKPAGLTGTLGTVKRPDNGKLQVTYNGSPLYTFKLDTTSGETKGNDFSDAFGNNKFTWHAAGATKTSGSGNNNNNGGYNYGGY